MNVTQSDTIIRSDYTALDEITRIIGYLKQEDNPAPVDYEWAISMIQNEIACTGRKLS